MHPVLRHGDRDINMRAVLAHDKHKKRCWSARNATVTLRSVLPLTGEACLLSGSANVGTCNVNGAGRTGARGR